MTIRLLSVFLALGLSACVEVQSAVDQTARTPARRAVTEAIFTRFPQVPKPLIEPFVNCIMDNATSAEINTFAGDALTGVDAETGDLIRQILSRPATAQCLNASVPQGAGVIL